MKKYLVISLENFFDGHGDPQDGALTKFVSYCEYFSLLNPDHFYSQNVEEITSALSLKHAKKIIKDSRLDEDFLVAEDGYNTTGFSYTVRELSDEQADEFEKAIISYHLIA